MKNLRNSFQNIILFKFTKKLKKIEFTLKKGQTNSIKENLQINYLKICSFSYSFKERYESIALGEKNVPKGLSVNKKFKKKYQKNFRFGEII